MKIPGLKYSKIWIFAIVLSVGYILGSFLIYKFFITNIYSELKDLHGFNYNVSAIITKTGNIRPSNFRNIKEIRERLAINRGEKRVNSIFIFSSVTFLFIMSILSMFVIISEKKSIDANERYKRIFKTNSAPMIMVDAETGEIADANQAAINFYGYRQNELIGANISKINPFMTEEEMRYMRMKMVENGPSVIFLKHRNKYGEKKEIKYFNTIVTVNKKKYIIGTTIDITEKDILENELEVERSSLKMLPETDRVTGAFNKIKFKEILKGWINVAEKNGSVLSLVLLGIDHFKEINDNFGHMVGDRILKVLSSAIKNHLRNTDILSRCGGGEFIIIMPETATPHANDIAKAILDETLSHSYNIPVKKVFLPGAVVKSLEDIRVSIGITTYGNKGIDSADNDLNNFDIIVKKAYMALYKARLNGGGRIEII